MQTFSKRSERLSASLGEEKLRNSIIRINKKLEIVWLFPKKSNFATKYYY